MKRIKVTGYIYVEDDEYDDGDLGPLTEAAFLRYSHDIGLDDLTFTEDPE